MVCDACVPEAEVFCRRLKCAHCAEVLVKSTDGGGCTNETLAGELFASCGAALSECGSALDQLCLQQHCESGCNQQFDANGGCAALAARDVVAAQAAMPQDCMTCNQIIPLFCEGKISNGTLEVKYGA